MAQLGALLLNGLQNKDTNSKDFGASILNELDNKNKQEALWSIHSKEADKKFCLSFSL